jgi:DNA repair exonuclease SbcCD nuclease subunit
MNKTPFAAMFTDLHLKDSNHKLCNDVLTQMLNYLSKNYIHTLFFIGDFFDSRDKQSLKNLLFFKKFLRNLEKRRIKMYTISGNHDKLDHEYAGSYLSLFKDHPSIQCFEEEDCLEFEHFYAAFLPYFPEDGSYSERLDNLIKSMENCVDKPRILLTHIAIDGIKNNDGSEVSNTLSQSRFKFFDCVYVGHYHKYSNLFVSRKNLIQYIGNLYQINHGEDQNKGFTIINEDLSTERVKTEFPHYYNFKVQANDNQAISSLIEQHKNSENNVRITIQGSSSDRGIYNKMFENTNIEMRFVDNDTVVSDDFKNNVNNTIKMDKSTVLKHWVTYSSKFTENRHLRLDGLSTLKNI